MSKQPYKITTTSGPGRVTLALSGALYRTFNFLGIPQNNFTRIHMLHLALSEMRAVDAGARAPAKIWVFTPSQDASGNPAMIEHRTITLFESGKGYTIYAIDPQTGKRRIINGVGAKPHHSRPD